MTLRLLSFCILLCACFPMWGNSVDGQTSQGMIRLDSLQEASGLAPGDEVWVGIKVSLLPGWRVYWKNPGSTGYPTTVAWTLPAGWEASDLHFPAPRLSDKEEVKGFVLEGDFSLFARLRTSPGLTETPKNNSVFVVSATFQALLCSDETCIPYEETLTYSFERAEKKIEHADLAEINLGRLLLPEPAPSGAILKANLSGSEKGTLSIRHAMLENLDSSGFEFFPFAEGVSAMQAERVDSKEIQFSWSFAGHAESMPKNLEGVLAHSGLKQPWNLSAEIVSSVQMDSSSSPSFVKESAGDQYFLLRILMGLVFVAMASWAYARSQRPSVPSGAWLTLALSALVISAALFFSDNEKAPEDSGLKWEPWSEGLENDLRKKGEAIFVDYTAKWCLSCQVNKRVYESKQLQAAFMERKVRLLRADWTKRDPSILASLQRFGREGVPFNVFYQSRQGESAPPVVLPEILTEESVREAVLHGRHSEKKAGKFGYLAVLGLAFLGGIVLNLMPCVFPVLGLKVLGFVKQAGENSSLILRHGMVYTAGVVLSFWLLAGILLVLRDGLNQELGWGFQLQEPIFVGALAWFLFVFGLSLSGVFDIGYRMSGLGASLAGRSGLLGSFLSGTLATVMATPCMAPFLGVAVGAALTMHPLSSLLVFTCVALGLSFPYLLLSLYPKWLKGLPKPGAWMESFRQFMAFPIYATVAWLIWTLDALN